MTHEMQERLQDRNSCCIMFHVTGCQSSNSLPKSALLEFTKATKVDWQGGVPLTELLDRINRVAKLLHDDGQALPAAGRVSDTFTERSFRHYQTLGCIDVPEKRGRLASYGFHHFVQALLVRRLLSERLPSEQIATMLANRETEELRQMLLGGVEIVARAGGGQVAPAGSVDAFGELWSRVTVVPGVELDLNTGLPQYNLAEVRRLIAKLKVILSREGSHKPPRG